MFPSMPEVAESHPVAVWKAGDYLLVLVTDLKPQSARIIGEAVASGLYYDALASRRPQDQLPEDVITLERSIGGRSCAAHGRPWRCTKSAIVELCFWRDHEGTARAKAGGARRALAKTRRMDQPAPRKAPYFDLDHMRDETAALARAYSGQDSSLRMALVERLKHLVDDAREAARRQLEADDDGRACAEGLSAFQDALIRLAYDFTTQHVYRADNPTAAERMAVVAQGGYGRGLLAPGSDIDLLFLLPYKQTAWGESVAEYMLYLLWDLGFKVGHATRTINQCISLSHSDMTIRTALLDARLILGDEALFAEFQRRFRKEVLESNARPFIEAKLAEQNERHKRAGASRYLVEPNIKDGKGGLRDLHTLHWLAKHVYPDKAEAEFVEAGVFTPTEYRSFRRCESFLWAVRCHLHFLTDRPEERLSFDVQQVMAERLGYRGHAGLSAVERFMRHYFLVAKEVGELTGIVCSALEMKQLKSLPALDTLLAPFGWRRRAKLRRTSDFRIENGRISTVDKDAFAKDPVNFIRLFVVADEHQASFSPEVLAPGAVELPPHRRRSPQQPGREPPVPEDADRCA